MKNIISKRDSNFELLRIISMLFIIVYHLVVHSGYDVSWFSGVNNFVLTFFMSGGKLGVILFVMITGYYMIKSKDVKYSKLIELELQVLFYSLGIYILFVGIGEKEFLFGEFLRFLFPNVTKTYWFFSSYFVLYLFIPFLNRLVSNISKKEFEKLLLIGLISLIVVPSVIIYNKEITEGVYLFYYYLVGGYIRLYCEDIKGGIKYLLGFIILYLFIVGITIFIRWLSYSNVVLVEYIYSFSRLGSVLLFMGAICLFLFFKGLKIKNNKIINLVASVSFGVYLFHEHIFMRDFLWKNIFSLDKLLNSGSIFINGIVVAVVVYLVGGVIELIRKVIFKYFGGIKKILFKSN